MRACACRRQFVLSHPELPDQHRFHRLDAACGLSRTQVDNDDDDKGNNSNDAETRRRSNDHDNEDDDDDGDYHDSSEEEPTVRYPKHDAEVIVMD